LRRRRVNPPYPTLRSEPAFCKGAVKRHLPCPCKTWRAEQGGRGIPTPKQRAAKGRSPPRANRQESPQADAKPAKNANEHFWRVARRHNRLRPRLTTRMTGGCVLQGGICFCEAVNRKYSPALTTRMTEGCVLQRGICVRRTKATVSASVLSEREQRAAFGRLYSLS
jgi:hypothetical protein